MTLYFARTDSSLLTPSMPTKGSKSLVRIQNTTDRAIMKRAQEWGYSLRQIFTYVDDNALVTVYRDDFGFHHRFEVIEVEG